MVMLVDEVMNVPITSTKFIQHGKHDWTSKTPTISWFSFYSLPMLFESSKVFTTSLPPKGKPSVLLSFRTLNPFLVAHLKQRLFAYFFLLLK